ncbi:MAG: monovalent cation/H+ antiporter complex subunit F [Alkalispirochaeta sp.]
MIPWLILLLTLFCGICLVRVLRGPTILDRIAAADAIGVMMTVILVFLGLHFERSIFIDVAIVYALLLFADLMVISRHLEQGDRR